MNEILSSGVVTGQRVQELYKLAQQKQFALPAVNVVNTNSINAVLESAARCKAPVIIQFSHGGSRFFIGSSLSNEDETASIQGGIAGAEYVHYSARQYGVPVILHTDHCSKKIVKWVDGLLTAGEEYFSKHGHSLYSSHMLDLSEEPLEENIAMCKEYLKRMKPLGMTLEIELGVTGGEEDGVDNSAVEQSKLYSQPEEVAFAYEELLSVSDQFTIAAAFGNVHGVYKPGNVKLQPKILQASQQFIKNKFTLQTDKPVSFVFHGGSGSTQEEIRESISYGVIKMNIDTDIQWAFWDGVNNFTTDKSAYLQSQIGNPTGTESPNKKYYDPRVWLRKGEESIVKRLNKSFEDLNAINILN